jgi:outer membrane protein assembly factor BamB
MTSSQLEPTAARKPLRLWPGAVFAVLHCLTLFVLPKVLPDQGLYWFMGTLVAGLGILLWWLFFSRARWSERLGALALMAVALFVTSRFLHVSVATAGQGMMFILYAAPLLCLAFGVAVIASHRFSDRARLAVMVTVILLASGGWTLVRVGGISMAGGMDVAWRWSPTPEELLLAQSREEPLAPPPAPAPADTPKEQPASPPAAKLAALPSVSEAATPPPAEKPAEWPGFRGAARDGIVRGVQIKTDWNSSPPVQLWRRPIGPGWSSFAVRGDLIYTQEQRGEEEVVSAYSLTTGKPVWRHFDRVRFYEANAGPGPRATPTLSDGRVYTFGATGILNALNADTGAVVWSSNVASETKVKVPYWGFASSPLVVDDVVIVAAAGTLAAYDIATGKSRWLGPDGGSGYSSPHRVTIDGIAQILLMSQSRVSSFAPADGQRLWEHALPSGARIVQPAMTAEGDILVHDAEYGGTTMRRLAITHESTGWTVKERWTSTGLKPYFNDFVVHKGHAYGFDGNILSCIDLNDGTRKWKGGRYGGGQLVLLADSDLLLVLSEEGELALVGATPDQFKEFARHPAIEGKTWNHPVMVGDVLLVRNAEEMAAFRLPVAAR